MMANGRMLHNIITTLMVNKRVRNYDVESEEPSNVDGSFVAEAFVSKRFM